MIKPSLPTMFSFSYRFTMKDLEVYPLSYFAPVLSPVVFDVT